MSKQTHMGQLRAGLQPAAPVLHQGTHTGQGSTEIHLELSPASELRTDLGYAPSSQTHSTDRVTGL